MTNPQKIIIADDHPLFRQALLQTLKARLPRVQWLEAESVSKLTAVLSEHGDADLVLLDLNIPGAHGFNTLISIRNQHPQLPTVIVSAYEDDDTVLKAMEFGASGFVPKSTPVEQIYDAIQQVLKGEVWLPEHIDLNGQVNQDNIGQRIASLTPQQHKILLMFADGLLNKQIAYQLNLSEATVKAHATAIFRKLNVLNRTQAVIAINQLDIGGTGSFSSTSE